MVNYHLSFDRYTRSLLSAFDLPLWFYSVSKSESSYNNLRAGQRVQGCAQFFSDQGWQEVSTKLEGEGLECQALSFIRDLRTL